MEQVRHRSNFNQQQQIYENTPRELQAGPTFVSGCLEELQSYVERALPSSVYHQVFKPPRSFILEAGPDPLDYIFVFKNDDDTHGPKHWHYIGFGLSDIYGYGAACQADKINRDVNPSYAQSVEQLFDIYPDRSKISKDKMISGFGFELTMRVAFYNPDEEPPKWPASLMQALASFVFQSKNVYNDGDHTAWICPLDGNKDSQIQHLLMTLDPQLQETHTKLGGVKFIQLVGVCNEELQAAREWQTHGVLNIMKQRPDTGGEYLVTDMTRGASIFQLDPEYREKVETGIRENGSGMISLSCNHKYSAEMPYWFKEKPVQAQNDNLVLEIAEISMPGVTKGNFLTMSRDDSRQKQQDHHFPNERNPSRMSCGSESQLDLKNLEVVDRRRYISLYLLLPFEAFKILPIVMKGVLAHKRHFSYLSCRGDLFTTLIPPDATIDSMVSQESPYVRQGPLLQIYVSDELREQILQTITGDLSEGNELCLPKNYEWPDYKFHITVVDELKDD